MLRLVGMLPSSIMRRLLRRATFGSMAVLAPCWFACSSPLQEADASEPDESSVGAVGCRASDGDAYAPGLTKAGRAGLFDFRLMSSSPAPPALNDNRFVIQIIDGAGKPVAGQLRVSLDMPEHGHPSPKQPIIRFDGETQTFSLEPMRLFMVGLWRIEFEFEGSTEDGSVSDAVSFQFCVE